MTDVFKRKSIKERRAWDFNFLANNHADGSLEEIAKNFISAYQVSEISLSLEKLTEKVVLVPPLVLKIKLSHLLIQTGSIRPQKINVVSFVGFGSIPPGAETRAILLSGAVSRHDQGSAHRGAES